MRSPRGKKTLLMKKPLLVSLLTVLLVSCMLALPAMAQEDAAPFETYVAYSQDNLFLYEEPGFDSETLAVAPPYTPVLVVGGKRNYTLIEYEQVRGYVPMNSLIPIRRDTMLDRPLKGYIAYPCLTYSAPLVGAAQETVLPRLMTLDIEAEYGDFYVTVINEEKCYVPKDRVITFPFEKTASAFAQTIIDAHVYMAPDPGFFSEVTVPKDHLLSIVGRCGAYYKLDKDQGYVRTRDVEVIRFRTFTEPLRGYWPTDQRLQYSQNSQIEPTDVTLYARTVVEIGYRTNKYYLVHYQDQWGYVPIAGFMKIAADTLVENRMAASLISDMTMELSDGTKRNGKTKALTQGTYLWALAKMEDGTLCSLQDGTTGFLPQDSLKELGQDVPQTARHIYAPAALTAYRFPIVGTDSVTIPGDTLVKQVGVNGNLFCVEFAGERVYLSGDQVYTDENAETLPGHTQRYYLLVEKLDHKLTVFLADKDGNRTDTVVRTIITAVGKPSTPTPSGIFKLGGKERWHRWGSGSRSPFAIEFASDRYIHGPIYWRADEASLKRLSLEDIGHDRTGGCLRMAYEDALWIYYHCASQETTLEIVKREADQ